VILNPVLWLVLLLLITSPAQADVTVMATVDRNRVAVGETFELTIEATGTDRRPVLHFPTVEGLLFAGPSFLSNVSNVNGQLSKSMSLVYTARATRAGALEIPSIEVKVAGQQFRTEPIRIRSRFVFNQS